MTGRDEMSDEELKAYIDSLPAEPLLTEPKQRPAPETVQGVIELLAELLKDSPELAEIPIYMYSDTEGNRVHQLWDLYVAMADADNPEALVLVPDHRPIGGW